MRLLKKIISSLLISAAVISCTERIDLPLDESSVRLVVEGAITSETTAHSVYLTQSTSYYYNQGPPVVTGASVNVTDGENVYELIEEEPGIYRTSNDFHGVEGMTYTLNIKLASPIGGYTDFTASSTISKIVILDSVSLVFYPEYGEMGLWEVKCSLQDSPSADFYRFELYRNEHLITHKLSKWRITDDTFFNGVYAAGLIVDYLDQNTDNEKLIPGDTLWVGLNKISREYFSFIQQAQSELRGSNPLFSGPGANVKGNISNGAIGFFAAYPVSRAYAIVRNP
jgi:hypothetical protein